MSDPRNGPPPLPGSAPATPPPAGGVVGWPGSPQDVPPLPGSFPLDTSKLPQAIRDEVEAPDPVAIEPRPAN